MHAIYLQMHHSMDQLDMLDPTGSMTTLAPISETPLTPTHQHLHGSYHSMNHMMTHHHPSSLSGHSAGRHWHTVKQTKAIETIKNINPVLSQVYKYVCIYFVEKAIMDIPQYIIL